MDDRQLPVLHQMHVQLRAEAVGRRPLEGGQRVLRYALLPVVEPPVGVPPFPEVRPVRLTPAAPQAQDIQQKQYQKYDQNDNNSFHQSFVSSSTVISVSPAFSAGMSLLSPCLTNSMVTKASPVNTAA